MVHVVVAVVVHDRVREHQHHVALELRRRPHLAALNVLLDRVQVHRSERGGHGPSGLKGDMVHRAALNVLLDRVQVHRSERGGDMVHWV